MKFGAKTNSGGILNGFIDRGALLEGTLTFDDTFRIDGQVKGVIISSQELVIGDAGSVEGEIRVGRLAVSGMVRGVVYAKERIEIHRGARIFAELHTPALVVEEGAVIQGPVETGPDTGVKSEGGATGSKPDRK